MTTPGVRSASYNRPPDSSSSTSDEQVPHTFSSPEDILGSIPSFVSSLPFPENYLISYACFSSISDEDLCDNLDNARLLLLESNIGKNLEDSLLPYVSLKRGQESLWIFSIASPSNDVHLNQPASLKFNGLEVTMTDRFSYTDIYPCSNACATQRQPCSRCNRPYSFLDSSPNISEVVETPGMIAEVQKASPFLPRSPLRSAHNCFLSAVRDRLIEDICSQGSQCTICRFGKGLLICHPIVRGEWLKGWEHRGFTYPSMFCQLDLSISFSGVVIRPHCCPTFFHPIPGLLPLPSGSPLNILPYATPAYFLNTYRGPTDSLVQHFKNLLRGLGTGNFLEKEQTSKQSRLNRDLNGSPLLAQIPRNLSQFSVIWVGVENKQGEEKGLIAIWPTDLCVTPLLPSERKDGNGHISNFAYGRKCLQYIPDMPLALQSSPVPSANIPPKRPSYQPAIQADDVSMSAASPLLETSAHAESSTAARTLQGSLLEPDFSSHIVRKFEEYSFSKAPAYQIKSVAFSVSQFVDSVAREREKERERMRKERDLSGQISLQTNSTAVPEIGGDLKVESEMPVVGTVVSAMDVEPSQPTNNVEPIVVESSQISYPSPPDDSGQTFTNFLNANGQDSQQQSFDELMAVSKDEYGFDAGETLQFHISNVSNDEVVVPGDSAGTSVDVFGAFTDDDFSFFDNPVPFTSSSAASLPSDPQTARGADMMQTDAPSIASMEVPVAPYHPHSGDICELDANEQSPNQVPAHRTIRPLLSPFEAPEMLTFSPSSPYSLSSSPQTPDINVTLVTSTMSSIPPKKFDALSFSPECSSLDAKYVQGKFGSQREDETEIQQIITPHHISCHSLDYNQNTDPRYTVIKRLNGIKRKRTLRCKGRRTSPPNSRSDEWASVYESDGDALDSVEEESDNEFIEVVHEDPNVQRPSTPPPTFLPPGPKLLSMRFKHFLLLPMSSSLRPANAFLHESATSPVPNPVPTPVSPGAALGASSERMKSLVAVLQILCRELVDNSVWAECWRSLSSQTVDERERSVTSGLFRGALQAAMRESGALSLERGTNEASREHLQCLSILHPGQIHLFECPSLSLSKGNSLIKIAPPALRFWKELGLGPRSGEKDALAFVCYQNSDLLHDRAERWLNLVSSNYTSRGFGRLKPGTCSECLRDGLIPMQFDSARKFLGSIVQASESASVTALAYILIPPSLLNQSVATFKLILLGLKRTFLAKRSPRLSFVLLPETVVSGEGTPKHVTTIDMISEISYNRILRCATRASSTSFKLIDDKPLKGFEAPPFTLVRNAPETVSFSFQRRIDPVGVLDQHVFLHVAYKVSSDRNWLYAAFVDQRGEAHDVKLWPFSQDDSADNIPELVWAFALRHTKLACATWCITFTKYGEIDEGELSSWITYLSSITSTEISETVSQVIFLSLQEGDQGHSDISNDYSHEAKSRDARTNPDHQPRRHSMTLSSSFLGFHSFARLPLFPACDFESMAQGSSVFEEDWDESQDFHRLRPLGTYILMPISRGPQRSSHGPMYINLLHLMKPTTTEETQDVLQTICNNFYDLSVLGKERWHLDSDLPFQLAALLTIDALFPKGHTLSL